LGFKRGRRPLYEICNHFREKKELPEILENIYQKGKFSRFYKKDIDWVTKKRLEIYGKPDVQLLYRRLSNSQTFEYNKHLNKCEKTVYYDIINDFKELEDCKQYVAYDIVKSLGFDLSSDISLDKKEFYEKLNKLFEKLNKKSFEKIRRDFGKRETVAFPTIPKTKLEFVNSILRIYYNCSINRIKNNNNSPFKIFHETMNNLFIWDINAKNDDYRPIVKTRQ
jgi:hypothetical protein